MNFKSLIPKALRLQYQLLRRSWNDRWTGRYLHFAKAETGQSADRFSKKLIQPLGNSDYVDAKIHNLKIASQRINEVLIRPGEIFSFWKIVGQPSARNGYQKGRNLVNGKLVSDYGGGLCQLSGAIYFLSLKTGLEIIERHNHSTDIYEESERYTPLGSDATVVFGYKDLRLKNCFNFALKFEIEVLENQLICHLKSEKELTEKVVYFKRNYHSKTVEVSTLIEGEKSAKSIYQLLGNRLQL